MSAQLIKTIKQKKPTLAELKSLFKKHNITDRLEIFALMTKHNLMNYVKKDTAYLTLKKKAHKDIDNAYKDFGKIKNAMKSLKSKLTQTFAPKKTRQKGKSTKAGGRRTRTKFPNCSQSMVSLAQEDCVKKHCPVTKKYKADKKKLAQLNTELNKAVAKTCNIEQDEYGEIWPEGEKQYACSSEQRKGPLFENILKLEKDTSTFACRAKNCKDVDYRSDCIDLGEEKCRQKYDGLIKSLEKKKKIKMASLEICSRKD